MALLALVLQLGLAFGHVHADHSAPAVAASTDGGVPNNQNNTHDPDDREYCATCAVLALLAGAKTAASPVVAPPVAVAATEITTTAEAARIGTPWTAFQSRAPPLS